MKLEGFSALQELPILKQAAVQVPAAELIPKARLENALF